MDFSLQLPLSEEQTHQRSQRYLNSAPDKRLVSSFLPTPCWVTSLWGRLCSLLGRTQLGEAGFSQNGCVMLLDTSPVAITPLRNKLPNLLGRASIDREMQNLLKCLGCWVF